MKDESRVLGQPQLSVVFRKKLRMKDESRVSVTR
jgi:hypothetical protein